MGWLRKTFSYFLGQMAYQYAFGQVKKKAVLIYLKTLQAMRRSLIVTLIIFCFLQLMVLGFLGASVTAIWLLPQDTNTKLYILLSFFALLFFVPFTALCFFLSEKMWFRFSGAEKLLKEI
jgi:Zn-dependent protease with chaperone function